ncbi:MAG: HAD family hydrolase [Candidatus Corynebacterium faecigallinarum]
MRSWRDTGRRVRLVVRTRRPGRGPSIHLHGHARWADRAGRDHREIWDELGTDRPRYWPEHAASDLYPDAAEFLKDLRRLGITVGIAGNQPERTESLLKDMGLPADFVASSTGWGVKKPSPEFFTKLVDVCGCAPEQVLYVGDRVDNDIVPAADAGLFTCHIRRGPWGVIQSQRPEARTATMRVESLAELFEKL